MNAKHTPAPWEIGTHPANHRLNIIKPVLFGSRVTVLPECEGGHVSINNLADARLIAAAPDLLNALKTVMGWIEQDNVPFKDHPDWNVEKQVALAAITKAEGGVA